MKELKKNNIPIAIALGYFDCVHFAHRKIISDAVLCARAENIKSAVLTFSNELSSKQSLPIYSYRERRRLISELEVDYIVPLLFDESLKKQSKEDFLEDIFANYNIKHIFCGSDYRFGYSAQGDVDFLKQFAQSKGVSVRVYPPIKMDGEVVSTSLIKEYLFKGNIKQANRLLCSPYFMQGKVTRGKGRGQSLGFPTANLKPKGKFLPRFGVYKSRTIFDGKICNSLTCIGNKPTFNDESITVETFINGDVFNLYGKTIHVELIDFIRDISRFSGVAQLKAQIKKDIEESL